VTGLTASMRLKTSKRLRNFLLTTCPINPVGLRYFTRLYDSWICLDLPLGKANDPARQRIAEIFQTWWACHTDKSVKASELKEKVKKVIDPQGRGRQYLATEIGHLSGTRASGMVLIRQKSSAKHGAATYSLQRTQRDESEDTSRMRIAGSRPPL
jgi:hypothetical protein